jgi:hypothetical protein
MSPRSKFPVGYKRCSTCREILSVALFYTREGRCKSCCTKRSGIRNRLPHVRARINTRRRAIYAAKGRTWEMNKIYAAKVAPTVRMFRSAKQRAKQSGIVFDLVIEDIIIPAVCPLLNIPIFAHKGQKGPRANSPSLDRLHPTKGYVRGNVWVISYRANAIKQNATLEELELLTLNLRHRLHPLDLQK